MTAPVACCWHDVGEALERCCWCGARRSPVGHGPWRDSDPYATDPPPAAEEVHDAIEDLVAEGKAERVVIDGVVHVRLTPSGMAAAAQLVERLANP